MNNNILLKKENVFNHMGECIKTGRLWLWVAGYDQAGGKSWLGTLNVKWVTTQTPGVWLHAQCQNIGGRGLLAGILLWILVMPVGDMRINWQAPKLLSQCCPDKKVLSIRISKSLFRLVLGAVLTFKGFLICSSWRSLEVRSSANILMCKVSW
jgi:hypothetical protein